MKALAGSAMATYPKSESAVDVVEAGLDHAFEDDHVPDDFDDQLLDDKVVVVVTGLATV